MKSLKKFLSILLTVSMILGMVSTTAFASIPIDEEGDMAEAKLSYYDGDTLLADISVDSFVGAKLTVNNTYHKEGFSLDKWNTKSDGSGTDYLPGSSITLAEDTSLYAIMTESEDNISVTIGDQTTKVSDLAAAFALVDASAEDATIKLLKDVNTGSIETTDTNKTTITLDLNGFEISVTGEQFIKLKDSLTITDTSAEEDGKITGTVLNDGSGFIYLNIAGLVKVEAGTIVANSKYLLNASGYKNSNFKITGGYLETTYDGGRVIRVNNADAISVSGGTLIGGFSSDNADPTKQGTFSFTGGSFSVQPSAYVADGYEAVNDGDYWVVEERTADAVISIATGGNKKYFSNLETMQSYIDTITEDANIVIEKDFELSTRLGLKAATEFAPISYTLDLNGKKLTYTGTNSGAILLRKFDSLVLTDSVGDGELVNVETSTYDNKYFFSFNADAGTLLVSSGIFSGDANKIAYASNASYIDLIIEGGTWSVDPTEYVGDGYKVVTNPDNTYTVVPGGAPYVVTIGTQVTEYDDFDKAFAVAMASTKDVTLKLYKDATTAGGYKSTQHAGIFTLDLNGKTITCTGEQLYCVYRTTFTLDDTSASQTGKIVDENLGENGVFYAQSTNALLTINAGTITGSHATNGIVQVGGSNSASLVVNGGSIINNGDGVSIKAGSSSYKPTITLNGGYFGNDMNAAYVTSFIITGGTFAVDPTSIKNATVNGEVKKNKDGTWTVTPYMFAKVVSGAEEKEFTSFDEALKYAYNNYTDGDEVSVILLKDVTTAGAFDLSTKAIKVGDSWTYYAPDITLDLNNHTLEVTGNQFVKLKAKFTVDDSSAEKEGCIYTDASNANTNGWIYVNGGRAFTFNNGAIYADSLASGKYLIGSSGFQNGDVNINGGYISSGSGYAARINNAGDTINITNGMVYGQILVSAGQAVISGGIFDWDPSAYVNKNIYQVNEDDPDPGLFTVTGRTDLPDVVKYNGQNYKFISLAIADILATPDKTGTIEFIADTIQEGTITVDDDEANITFDLGGRTITEATATQMFLLKGGNFTIKNGTILAAGQIATSGHIRVNNATLLVKDITFDGDKTQSGTLTNINSKNGGAFYIYGSDATFDNVVIKNCLVRDMGAGTGNSGAVHIVKQNVDVVSNVTFTNGSKIDNCQAAVQGGAVSVGSGCTFTLEEGCSISNCKASMGGAIYIDISDDKNFPAKTDYLCGEAYIDGAITNSAGTDEGTNKAPIVSRGFAYIGGEITTDGIVFQRETLAKLATGQLSLKDDLVYTLGYKVAWAAEDIDKDLGINLTIDGKEVDDSKAEITADEIIINGLTAAQMADEIKVRFVLNDYSGAFLRNISNEYSTSIVKYCEAAFNPEDESLCTLLANTLKYGQETQKAWTESSNNPVVIPDKLLPYVVSDDPTEDDNVKAVTKPAIDSAHYKISSATLNVNDKVAIIINILAVPGKNGTIKVSNGTTTKDYAVEDLYATNEGYAYRLELDRLSPTQFDSKYTVTFYAANGTTILHEITYSVNSYCYAKSGNALAKAIYNYGLAAEAYVEEHIEAIQNDQ